MTQLQTSVVPRLGNPIVLGQQFSNLSEEEALTACFVEHREAPTYLNIPSDSRAAACRSLTAISALGTSRALAVTGTQELFQADPGGVRVSL